MKTKELLEFEARSEMLDNQGYEKGFREYVKRRRAKDLELHREFNLIAEGGVYND